MHRLAHLLAVLTTVALTSTAYADRGPPRDLREDAPAAGQEAAETPAAAAEPAESAEPAEPATEAPAEPAESSSSGFGCDVAPSPTSSDFALPIAAILALGALLVVRSRGRS